MDKLKQDEISLLAESQIELRSPEMQEIIGRVPNRIIRWGIVVIFSALVFLLFLSWFIRYPDLITAKVVITTTPPPITLVSRAAGNLALLKKENEIVHTGDAVAFIQSNAVPNDVLNFEKTLLYGDIITQSQRAGALGDLLPLYNDIQNSQEAFTQFKTNRVFEMQIKQLEKTSGFLPEFKVCTIQTV